MSNFYSILGVDKSATQDEIKKAYRKKAKEHHPDKGGDETMFKQINEAYETLSDENKRREYDNPRQNFGFGGFPNSGFGGFDFREPRVGQTLVLNISMTLEQIFSGETKKFKYHRHMKCDSCGGKGGLEFTKCVQCNGRGEVIRQTQINSHIFQQVSTCPSCHGNGETAIKGCDPCDSRGIITKEDTVEVDIPKGITNGAEMYIEHKGHAIKNGEYGDLIIKITELPHNIYVRAGNDLQIKHKIPYTTMVLGGETIVPTIEGGKIKIKISEGSEIGKILRIPNKGLPIFDNNNRGNMVIELSIDIPKNLSKEEKELLEKIKEIQEVSK